MLKARVITALFLVAGFLGVLFWLPAAAATGVFVLVTTLAAWEWGGLIQAGSRARWLFAGVIAISCGVLWASPAGTSPLLWALAAVFWIGVVPFWLASRQGAGAFGYLVGWVVLVPTWAALTDLHARSPWLLLAVMALVWVADIAAYFAGRAFGRHKLAPAISPGKTWEGVAGAVLGVLGYGLLVSPAVPGLAALAWTWLVPALLLLTGFSVCGDLFESMLKRQAGLKDSSKLLPGHGGILDRIDSQTSTLPLAALALWVIA